MSEYHITTKQNVAVVCAPSQERCTSNYWHNCDFHSLYSTRSRVKAYPNRKKEPDSCHWGGDLQYCLQLPMEHHGTVIQADHSYQKYQFTLEDCVVVGTVKGPHNTHLPRLSTAKPKMHLADMKSVVPDFLGWDPCLFWGFSTSITISFSDTIRS